MEIKSNEVNKENEFWLKKIQDEISTVKSFLLKNLDTSFKETFGKFEKLYNRVLEEFKKNDLNVSDLKILYGSLLRSVKKLKREMENSLKLSKTDSQAFMEKFKSENKSLLPIMKDLKLGNAVKIKAFDLEVVSDYKFPVLEYTNQELCDIALNVFEYLQLDVKLDLDKKMLKSLIEGLCKNYNVIPYHNFSHAFSVFQMLFHIYQVSELNTFITPLDIFSGLLASLAHDLNHKGVNNLYKIKKQSHKCLLYSEQSVLENSHSSCFFTLLRDPKLNILSKLTDPNHKSQFKKLVVSSILGTDMAKHNHLTTKFSKRVNATFSYRALLSSASPTTGTADDVTKELALLPERFEDKKFLLKLLIHASDIGNPCLPFDSYINWSILVTQEFNDQTIKEAQNNLEVTAFLKFKDKKAFFDSQTFFSSE